MARRAYRDASGRFAKSSARLVTARDSGGLLRRYTRSSSGKLTRISEEKWKGTKDAKIRLAKEARESEVKREQRQRDQYKRDKPVARATDPGRVTSRGHYRYSPSGRESSRLAGPRASSVSVVERIEAANEYKSQGAAEGNHVKDMGTVKLDTVLSVEDAAVQIAGKYNVDPDMVIINGIFWNRNGYYDVEVDIDFSNYYEGE